MSRERVDAALRQIEGAGCRSKRGAIGRAVRRRLGLKDDVDPRGVAVELDLELLAVTDRETLAPGERAAVRGRRILYLWTHEDWRENLWYGIALALCSRGPRLRACSPTLVKFRATSAGYM